MNLSAIERFHDNNRYFIPMTFISIILILYGFNCFDKGFIHYDVPAKNPLFFSEKAVLHTVYLRPQWLYKINVQSNKPLTIQVYNLNGQLINESINNMSFKPDFAGLYFIKAIGSGFVLYGFDYGILGLMPIPDDFLFFGSGLIIFLLTLLFYLLKPFRFELKRKMPFTDAIFYSLMGVTVFVILWVFKESFIQLLNKTSLIVYSLIIACLALIGLTVFVISKLTKGEKLFFKKKKYLPFFINLSGFFNGYLALFLTSLINLTSINSLITQALVLLLLVIIFVKYDEKTGLIIYLLSMISSLMMRVMAFSIGVPVYFDNLLSIPSEAGAIPLLLIIELFIIAGVYFFLKAYYSKSVNQAINYGFYAGVMIQSFMQALLASTMI